MQENLAEKLSAKYEDVCDGLVVAHQSGIFALRASYNTSSSFD